MDYEKKYKEAVNKIRDLLDDGEKNGFTIVTYKTDLESIFPELKESEDERIRKELISLVENWKIFNPNSPFDEHPVYTSDKDTVDKILAWLEKQGEQKPTIEMKSAEESLGIDSDTYNEIVDECIYGEQKYWSEEDEKMLKSIIGTCELAGQDRDSSPAARHLVEIQTNWLKSLKDRCDWKPSDEQMKCLSDVVHKAKYKNDISVGGYSAYMPLASLYLDLKKLREE